MISKNFLISKLFLLCLLLTKTATAQINALQLDNSQNNYIQWIETNTLIETHPNFTIELWIKAGNSSHGKMIYCEGGHNSNLNMFRLFASGRKIILRPNGSSVNQISSTGGDIFTDPATWKHIAVTGTTPGGLGTETTLTLYIDGVFNTSGTYTRNSNNYSRTVLGNLTKTTDQTTSYAFDGEIDELRLWSRALPVSELANNQCAPFSNTDLVKHIRFEEASGNTVYDEISKTNESIQGSQVSWSTNNSCSDKLVAYFPFNGNTNDESLNNNPGINHGAQLTTNRYRQANRAYQFDGISQYIELPDINDYSIATTNKLSISIWQRIDTRNFTNDEGDGYVYWFGKGASQNHEWSFRMYNYASTRPNRNSIYAFNLTGGLGAGSYIEETVTIGEWIHYVALFNYSTNTIQLYKNGVLQDADLFSDYSIIPGNGSTPIRIGTRNFTSYFKGALDDIRIYGRILTSQEILKLYQNESELSTGTLSKTNQNQLSIETISQKNLYSFPNPVEDELHLNYPTDLNAYYTISNLYGRIVTKGIVKPIINIKNLKSSIYILSLQDKDTKKILYRQRLIKR